MIASPRFLIAKYIPEARRMEPRNIGVILWADGLTSTRFLGDDAERKTIKSYPRFVGRLNRPVYKDWVSYWRKLATSDQLPDARNRSKIPRQSPQFLDALKLKSKENFILLEGGVFPVALKPKELAGITEELFAELVDDGKTENAEATEATLLSAATKAFVKHVGLITRPDFHRDYPVQYQWHDVSRHARFGFGLGGTKDTPSPHPLALFQPTRLMDAKDVNNSLFMFEGITDRAILPKERCASLIYGGVSLVSEDDRESIASLDKVSTVIDVSNPALAAAVIRQHLSGVLGINGNGNGNGHHGE